MNDRPSKLKGSAWLLAACGIGIGLALGLSPVAHAIPWSWEKKLGSALQWETPQQECRYESQAQALLQRLVKRLYPIETEDDAFSIDVQISKNSQVNAYAALGGQIFINSGLLKQAQSPEEVAGVLAHEIEHVRHRHIMQGFLSHLFTSQGISLIFGTQSSAADWAGYFVTMNFSRTQEAEADEEGLRRLQIAHIDNQGFKDFFARMERSGASSVFPSDHPSHQSRIAMAEKFTNDDVTPILTPEEWKVLKDHCG
jgi:predicted Zn-dependent protease